MSHDEHPIRGARREEGKTVREVATALGVSERTVRRWELAETIPASDSLIRLARMLRRRPEDLVRVA